MTVMAWDTRAAALTPAGLVAPAALARTLLPLLGRYEQARLQALSAVVTRDWLVLLGANDALPWIDGARYCAPHPEARNLWTPTQLSPRLPADLVQANLVGRAGGSPLLLWHAPEMMVPLAGAQALTPAMLDWLGTVLA